MFDLGSILAISCGVAAVLYFTWEAINRDKS